MVRNGLGTVKPARNASAGHSTAALHGRGPDAPVLPKLHQHATSASGDASRLSLHTPPAESFQTLSSSKLFCTHVAATHTHTHTHTHTIRSLPRESWAPTQRHAFSKCDTVLTQATATSMLDEALSSR